jgi:hypothetical protein
VNTCRSHSLWLAPDDCQWTDHRRLPDCQPIHRWILFARLYSTGRMVRTPRFFSCSTLHPTRQVCERRIFCGLVLEINRVLKINRIMREESGR